MNADELDRLERERREADARYNDALTALDRVIVGVNGRELSREDAERIGTALLVFLQQITGFVESKDRVLAGAARESIETVQLALEPIEVIARQRASVRLRDHAIERRQCRVVRAIGVAPLPVESVESVESVEPVEVVGRHARLINF